MRDTETQGAGMCVYHRELIAEDHPLLVMENVVTTPSHRFGLTGRYQPA
jgi:phosphoglycerate dehydrogenase-like enzyme